MTIIHWNINGINNHYTKLQMLTTHCQPNYICLQETHLKPEQALNIKHYKIYRKNRQNTNHASGGVA